MNKEKCYTNGKSEAEYMIRCRRYIRIFRFGRQVSRIPLWRGKPHPEQWRVK